MVRIDKTHYYINIAHEVAKRGTCLRRSYGAVIVNNDEIVSTGYTGAPRGRANCCELGYCLRSKMNVPRGERYELCRSVHAEQNAIISASRSEMLGATMYVAGFECDTGETVKNADSCSMCKRFIINAGIDKVVFEDDAFDCGYRVVNVSEWVENDNDLSGKLGY